MVCTRKAPDQDSICFGHWFLDFPDRNRANSCIFESENWSYRCNLGANRYQNSVEGSVTANDFVAVYINVTAVNPIDLTSTSRFAFYPVGSFDSGTLGMFNTSLIVTNLGQNKFPIPAQIPEPMTSIAFPLIDGDPNKYPFDVYSARYFLSASIGNTTIPIFLHLVGAVQGWSVLADISEQAPNIWLVEV